MGRSIHSPLQGFQQGIVGRHIAQLRLHSRILGPKFHHIGPITIGKPNAPEGFQTRSHLIPQAQSLEDFGRRQGKGIGLGLFCCRGLG